MKKSLAALALAGSIALVGAVPAMANTPYPAPSTSGTVTDGTVAPGETFTFSGSGFLAGEAITVTVTLTRAPQAIGGGFSGGASMAVPAKISLPLAPQTFATTADADGNFAFPVSISEAGTYTLAATGLTSGKTVTSSVTVDGATVGTSAGVTTSGSASELADTGANSSMLLWSLVGAGALAVGATSVVVVRRRAKAEAAA
jgi:LPXTG-motif cell wall-anchored protein